MRMSAGLYVALLTLWTCTPAPDPDGGHGDASTTDRGRADVLTFDAGGDDSAGGFDRTAPSPDGGIPGPFGFTILPLTEVNLPCEEFGQTTTHDYAAVGYVCDLQVGALEAAIYVHATPTGTTTGMSCTPTFQSQGWISINSEVSSVPARYDFGGGHQNNWIEIDREGRTYRYDHSSFGWGWRACHPPDCVQVFEGDDLIEDGCTTERSLPAVCMPVADDGNVPELVDTFEPCPGDPNRDAG